MEKSMFYFDRETAVQPNRDCWRGFVNPNWNIGDNPNGGYLVSIALNAAKQLVEHPDPLTVTTHFLRPGIADTECDVAVEVVRVGRMLSTARATLKQSGKARIEVLATFGDLSETVGVADEITVTPPTLPPPEACIQRSGETQGIHLPILNRLDVQLHPDQALAGTSGKAEVSGWIRFPDGRDPDTWSLPLFTDAFPPSPFGLLGVVGWVPTVELTVQLRRRPAPGWIAARFATEDLVGGRMVESGCLWDSTGSLVAQSRQLGLVMRST
jgi:acyl-CoA thioesterase